LLYNLLAPLKDISILFNLFRYITFRIGGAAVTSFLFAIVLTPILITFLKKKGVVSNVREDVPERHEAKKGTPTMGGLIILFATVISVLLWVDLTNTFVWYAVFATLLSGILGFFDDYVKDVKRSSNGLLIRQKLLWQILLGLAIGAFLYFFPPYPALKDTTEILFIEEIVIRLGFFYIFTSAIVIVASVNAINITDGLDGLALGGSIIVISVFTILAYITGRVDFSNYLKIFYLPGAGELSIFCAAFAGSGLGLLWYNSYPSQIFLGDTGSLALGGGIGAVAIMLKKEALLFIVGGIFVIEALSVLMQIVSFRWFGGKRIFKMAPLHHHFELLGWPEPKIVTRFWITGIIFALVALGSFKIR